ncbi:MAG: NUDIX domain-containing protein [Anaerolineales bacterium]|nr:NUDIX domain-containing protein [Anaerolineales bacterium]MBX3036175.1 NUDIX domain-containing protein [Anaerolineales bacterium]
MYLKLLYLGFKIYCFIFRPVRMGVRVMMIQDDKVLLIRHTYLEGWFMPGGGLNRNESLEQATRREAKEETGADLGEVTLLGVFSNFIQWKTDHTVVFLCKDFRITGKSDAEIAEMQFFSLSDLPKYVYPSHRKLLEAYQAGEIKSNFGEW